MTVFPTTFASGTRFRLSALPILKGQTGLFSYSEENLNALKARESGRIRQSEAPPDPGGAELVPHQDSLGSSSPPENGDERLRSPQAPVGKPFVASPIGEPPEEFRKIDLARTTPFLPKSNSLFSEAAFGPAA